MGKWKLVAGGEGTKEVVIHKDDSDVKLVMDIDVSDEHLKITELLDGVEECNEFALGTEFEDTVDARNTKWTFVADGGKLIGKHKRGGPEDENLQSEWYLENGKLVITTENETGFIRNWIFERASTKPRQAPRRCSIL